MLPTPAPCRADPVVAWALFAGLGLTLFTAFLAAFEVVMILPYRCRRFRRWRLRRLNPPKRSV